MPETSHVTWLSACRRTTGNGSFPLMWISPVTDTTRAAGAAAAHPASTAIAANGTIRFVTSLPSPRKEGQFPAPPCSLNHDRQSRAGRHFHRFTVDAIHRLAHHRQACIRLERRLDRLGQRAGRHQCLQLTAFESRRRLPVDSVEKPDFGIAQERCDRAERLVLTVALELRGFPPGASLLGRYRIPIFTVWDQPPCHSSRVLRCCRQQEHILRCSQPA